MLMSECVYRANIHTTPGIQHTTRVTNSGSMLAHRLLHQYNPELALYYNTCPQGGRYRRVEATLYSEAQKHQTFNPKVEMMLGK